METIVHRIKEWRARRKIHNFVRKLARASAGTIVSIKEDPTSEEICYYVFQHVVMASPQIFYGFLYNSLEEARRAVAANDIADCTLDQMFWYWPDGGWRLIENYEHMSLQSVVQCFQIVESPPRYVPVDIYVELPLSFVDFVVQHDIPVYQDYMDQGFGEISDRTTLKEWYNKEDGSFRGEDLLIKNTDLQM